MDVIPINYKLTFEPDLKKFTFDGTESITVDCKKSTNALPVKCVCGEYIPDSFECGKKIGQKYCNTRIEGVCNDRRKQSIVCKGCGHVWEIFELNNKPYIFYGRCPKCKKHRESGRIIRRL